MIVEIPLSAVPNQSFSYVNEGDRWDIRIFTAVFSLCADIRLNGEPVVLGQRMPEDDFIIQSAHRSIRGNFLFSVAQNEYGNYQELGRTQFLYFFSPDEFIFND